jgi:CHAT domain-containing protein
MISGRLVLRSLANAFLSLSNKGKSEEADEVLRAMRFAGGLDRQHAKDPLFAEIADFYGTIDANKRATLLEAQELLSNGLRLCVQGQYADALQLFLAAAAKMRNAGDHWNEKIADYWIAYSYYKTDRVQESLEILNTLIQSCEAAGYRWLQSQAISQTGNIETDTNDLSRALESYSKALDIAEDLSDVYSIQKALCQLGSVYRLLADYRQSLAYLDRAVLLGGLHLVFPRQAWRNYSLLAQTLYSAKINVAAEVYGREALRLSIDELKDPATIYITQLNLGLIARRTRGDAEAMDLVRASFNVIDGLPNDGAKGGMLAKALLHEAHLKRYAGNYTEALNDYDKAIEIYDKLATVYEKYEMYKGRLLCHLAIRNDSIVRAQLPVVLQLYETYRSKILEERNRNSFFEAEQDVYDIAIDFAMEQDRDPQLAFELSEKSRSRSLLDAMKSGGHVSTRQGIPELFLTSLSEPLPLPILRSRLPENVQIIQYAVLDDRVVIWLISRNDFKAFERRIAPADLKTLVFNFRNSVLKPGSKLEEAFVEGSTLYATLLSPIASLLSPNKVLCVVPDKFLNYLPFAALTSPETKRPVAADYALMFAPSSNVFLMCSENAESRSDRSDEHLLSIGNPSFNRKAYPTLSDLPSAEREANNVAQLYKSPTILTTHSALKNTVVGAMTDSDVVHYAGHYVADHQSPMLSKLVLASNSNEEADSLNMHEVFSRHLSRTRLLILSACGTAIERSYDGEGMVGVARAFIAAGVPLIVATQWEIDSDATLSLMTSFHRYRKLQKMTTVEALRRAQSDMVYGPDEQYRAPYFWAGFIIIGGYASY